VFEGSSLGSQLIIKALKESMKDCVSEFHYFNPYGADTRSRWQYFCESLNSFACNSASPEAIIHSAKETFMYLHDHLSSLY